MLVGELMERLAQFDPECKVKVAVSNSSWGYDDELEHSVETFYTGFESLQNCYINQDKEGVVYLGDADE